MYSTLFIIVSFIFTSINASLVSSVDFYPLSPEIVTESTKHVKEGECKNGCLNEGNCVLNGDGSTTCSCSSNFFGEYCQHEGEQCGDGFCHHSSTCFELSLEEESFVEHICDCTNGYTEETYYAGEFCQYKSTQFCSGPNDPNGRQFCVNGGQCPGESHLPCICPEGFSGPRCAFQIGIDGRDFAQCELSCQNGGNCQKGAKETKQNEIMGKFVDVDFSEILPKSPDLRSFEHCVCPPGYFGIYCEYQMEQCDGGEHLCFHGSTCAKNADTFSCDCFSSKIKTAGLFCEYVASSECEQWVDVTSGHRGFCTNGGHCEVDGYGSAVCMCPSGYMGEHCEYRVDINEDPFKSSHQIVHQGAGFFKLLGLILIIFGAIVGSVVYFYSRPFGQTKESAVNITENGTSSCCDNIQLDNTMISKKEADEHGGYPGFSGVELL